MEENSNKFGWFLAGAVLGVSVGMLYAPKSGKETRDSLSQSVKDAEASGHELMERGRELYERGRKIADDAADLFERGRRLVQG